MATTPVAAQVPRDPRSSMKSTWRNDKAQWGPVHYLLDFLGMHPTDPTREIPVHEKNSPIPGLPHWSAHRWVLAHALWPLIVQQIYIWVTGKNMHPFAAFLFYNVAYIANGAHEVHMLKFMGHKYGFFDGDKHARDQIPDHSVNRVLRSLILTATFRPMFSIFLAYRSAQQPIHLHWLIPVEVGVYGITLDFWFYWYHRVMHQFDSLWKYHRTHHLTKHPNPLLTLYADSEQEIFDIAGIPILTWATMKLLGFPMGFYEWWICHNYVVFTELFGHSGVRIWAATTSTNNWFLGLFNAELQIEDHDLHHRQGWKKSMNYGKQTLLWDTIFNTRGPRYEALEHQVNWEQPAQVPLFWWGSPAALKKNQPKPGEEESSASTEY